MSHDEQAACACDNWICPHNEEKIRHLPGVVKGVAQLKQRVEEMRQYWQESEAALAKAREELKELGIHRVRLIAENDALRSRAAYYAKTTERAESRLAALEEVVEAVEMKRRHGSPDGCDDCESSVYCEERDALGENLTRALASLPAPESVPGEPCVVCGMLYHPTGYCPGRRVCASDKTVPRESCKHCGGHPTVKCLHCLPATKPVPREDPYPPGKYPMGPHGSVPRESGKEGK